MRVLPIAAVLGAALFSVAVGHAQAAPAAFNRDLAASRGPIIAVQMHCDQFRCINLQTGAYTQSGCDRYGCHPISGVIGHADPSSLGLGSGSSYQPNRWHDQHRHHHDGDDWR